VAGRRAPRPRVARAARPRAAKPRVPTRPARHTTASGPPRVGILALQGDFALHAAALRDLGCEPVLVTLPEHLQALAALVLPGGESSTMLRLLDSTGLRAPLEEFVRDKPVLGTCAGLILLAKSADKLPRPTLGAIDVVARRNAWGRQVHSFTGAVDVAPLGGEMPGVFIRAPRIAAVGKGVEVIARRDGEPVGVRQGHVAAIAFHPELTDDRRLHEWFLRDVAGLATSSRRSQ